ncbi:MAG: DNA-protecting protein DprA [Gammaproteobacteria bacterium]|nr:MAG: DNA-protecting protein DprA [Gammaproteobacteria bacterium]
MAGAEGAATGWLALHLAPGLGAVQRRALLEAFPDPREALHASPALLRKLGLRPETIGFLGDPDHPLLVRHLEWSRQPGCSIVTLVDPRYPPLLREIEDPPPLLFVRGDPALLARPQLAIVGSRRPTPAGRELAREFAARLARFGLVITSGLAHGIDGCAHEGALEAGGKTIAVTGTGPDRIYPAANEALARRIAGEGALVTEYPLGTPPLPGNFPRRNRIIAGLSVGTLVVEADLRSGSLISARLAMESGREVFAIPGPVRSPVSRGCHALIRQGATLVTCVDEVLEELGPLIGSVLDGAEPAREGTDTGDEAPDPEYRQLLEAMAHEPVSVDELVQRTGLTPQGVSSMLLLLELKGQVSVLPGGRYQRIA